MVVQLVECLAGRLELRLVDEMGEKLAETTVDQKVVWKATVLVVQTVML